MTAKYPLRILLLEDNSTDADLIRELLETEHFTCEITRVETRCQFVTALDGEFDLILADYALPRFDGLAALELALSARPELPFIFVSGTLGEEVAIETLKLGATDYVLKTRMSRLVPSVNRALREAEERAERKKAEEGLRRSEAYLAEAQRLSHTGTFGWDVSSREVFWSDETFRIFECEPATKPTLDLVIDRTHPEDRTHLRHMIDRAATDRSEFTARVRLIMLDGAVKYVGLVAHRAAGEHPESLRYVGAVTDITERKHAERTLREQANLLDLTHDAIFVHDMNGVITYWNHGAGALYGWTADEACGNVAPELLKTAFPFPFELKNGRWEGELVRTTKDSTQVVVASRWSLQRDAKGVPVAILETNNDITERKRAEEAVRRSEKELRDLIEHAPAMMFIALPGPSNAFTSRGWREYTGLSAEDTAGSGWQSVVHSEDLERHLEKWRICSATGEAFEDEGRFRRAADGEYRWFLVRAVPLRDESGNILRWYGTLTDIEDRKLAEEALRESEQRFRDYAEIASDWLWETGSDHRFTRFSRSSANWGFVGEFIGTRRWEVAADREEEPDKWRTHIDTLEAHEPFRGLRYRASRPDGSALYLSVSGKPVFDANGQFLGYRGVATEISAEVRAEQAERALRQAQAELAHVTRVTTLGELAASIAHEVNQPLMAVVMGADAGLRWLDRQEPNLPEARESMTGVIKAAKHAADVITRLRALTRKTPVQKVEVDINKVILEVTALTRTEMDRNRVKLGTQLADDLPPVKADRIELQQVILNLIINAIEAMSDGDRRDLLVGSAKGDINNVRVSVCDSGRGVDPTAADRMFQAFYTTKPGGMGMGLAICRSIIERLGGQLSARASALGGTIFEFSIPIEEGAAPTEQHLPR